MLDAAAQHPGRTGRETLRLAGACSACRNRPRRRHARAGRPHRRGRRRVGSYSLGMRQRLGIGTALLGDPAVLVLDEPANGLDPEGIRWMRDLLQDFAARGGTVLLSSHLLREVEHAATGSSSSAAAGSSPTARSAPCWPVRRRPGPGLRSPPRSPRPCVRPAVRLGLAGGLAVAGATTAEVGRIATAGGRVLTRTSARRPRATRTLFFQLAA